MGGTTLSYTGKTIEEVLEKLKKGILDAIHIMQPDSDAAVLKPSEKIGKAYTVETIWKDNAPIDVKFTDKGNSGNVGMPVTVASLYGPKPAEDEWVGCIHLHT